MIAYAVTIALSAFLLFLAQPVIAKQILPWFGGTAAVWTTCMMFFQVVLLGGYAYADVLIRRVDAQRQRLVHGGVLLASLAFLPITLAESLRPLDAEHPASRILWLLVVSIGLPYFALSTTGPLLQAWFTRQFPQARVYRLYALSNAASLAALVLYPVLIEPASPTRWQSLGWSTGYAVFVTLVIVVAWRGRRTVALADTDPRTVVVQAAPGATANGPTSARTGSATAAVIEPPALREQLAWLILAALGSLLLLAVTAHLTHNVAAVPFLWLLPLVLYLLSFILCFDGRGWYRPRLSFALAVVFCVLMTAGLLFRFGPGWRLSIDAMPIEQALLLYLVGLFVLCMFLHGELSERRPAGAWLTRFYLMVSLGGALGGVFAGVVAPALFDGYFELPLALVAIGLVLLFTAPGERSRFSAFAGLAATASAAVLVVAAVVQGAIDLRRDFYGVLRVTAVDADVPGRERLRFAHGNTVHGEQLTADGQRRKATTYFGADSGIARTIAALRAIDGDRPQRIGIVGLGVGTLAVYGRPGDTFRFYEIAPLVERMARSHFTFLADAEAKVQVSLGDGRLILEREPPQGFRLLVLDAFSSDSVPVHLLTAEAMNVYERQVDPDGAVAFNISNRYLNLAPVVRNLADASGWRAIRLSDRPPADRFWLAASDWVVVTANSTLADALIASGGVEAQRDRRVAPWTDGFSNMFTVLKSLN